MTPAPYRRALVRLASYVRELTRVGIRLRYLDVGGGLGVRYSSERPMTKQTWGRTIASVVRPLGCHVLLEPGRSIVAPSGVLLTRVLYTKRNGSKTFVVVDAAMNDLMRPALYGAVHPVTPAKKPSPSAKMLARADVVGPVCESGDCFVQDWPVGDVAAGDLLTLWGTGAYGFAQASNYNQRPRPAEVLVEGKSFRVVRRRESRADLLRGE
jgi:diaminopimelate decarboxylase